MKIFRKSPVKNALLQEKFTKMLHKTLQLCVDVKTRWNSTETMLEHFIRGFDCIKETLSEIGLSGLMLDSDFEVAKNLQKALQPIRLASEALGRRDATLLSAENSLSFLYSKLKKSNSKIGNDLFDAITKRINERRHKEIITALKFLQGLPLSTQVPAELESSTKTQMNKFIKELGVRLLQNCQRQTDDDAAKLNAGLFCMHDDSGSPSSMREELESAIMEYANPSQTDSAMIDFSKVIAKELSLFELHGKLSTNLEIIFGGLKSIKPTSTDSERIFSISGNICSKKRTSMSDESINNICFSKSYFQRRIQIDKTSYLNHLNH